MNFEAYRLFVASHALEHLTGTASTRDYSCLICYPAPYTVSAEFSNFWNWVASCYQVLSYSKYTTTAFSVYCNQAQRETNWGALSDAVYTATRLFFSLTYTNYPTKPLTQILLEFVNLARRTNYFQNVVTPQLYHQLLVDLANRSTMTNPATGAEIQTALTQIFGNNGANLTNLTTAVTNLANPGPRELSLVKVEPFYGRDDEDPVEWLETFNRAATA